MSEKEIQVKGILMKKCREWLVAWIKSKSTSELWRTSRGLAVFVRRQREEARTEALNEAFAAMQKDAVFGPAAMAAAVLALIVKEK